MTEPAPKPLLMGILNLTDNSFLESSRALGLSDDALALKAGEMFSSGAGIIDIGACSTAPGNAPIPEEEEWARLERPLALLADAFPDRRFSLDTFRSGIVRKAVRIMPGIIVNDISAGEDDPEMLGIVAAEGLDYIAMDRSSDPYGHFESFSEKAAGCGIRNWILDPGFGFGKTIEENWDILRNLQTLKDFGRPILAALSRKRMIYQPLGLTPATCADESFDAERLAAALGASIIRTHDLDLWSRL